MLRLEQNERCLSNTDIISLTVIAFFPYKKIFSFWYTTNQPHNHHWFSEVFYCSLITKFGISTLLLPSGKPVLDFYNASRRSAGKSLAEQWLFCLVLSNVARLSRRIESLELTVLLRQGFVNPDGSETDTRLISSCFVVSGPETSQQRFIPLCMPLLVTAGSLWRQDTGLRGHTYTSRSFYASHILL